MTNRHLNAYITAKKPHFVPKVIQYRQNFPDAFKPQMRSYMSVFIPKINLEFSQPCVMLYTNNGNGRCLIRSQNPGQLADKLEQLVMILRSDLWADLWLQLDGTADDIINNNFVNDEKFIDL